MISMRFFNKQQCDKKKYTGTVDRIGGYFSSEKPEYKDYRKKRVRLIENAWNSVSGF